jgi:hypothetical protein
MELDMAREKTNADSRIDAICASEVMATGVARTEE